MNKKHLILVVSISLLVLSGYMFYSAYQLWVRYNEALDWFNRAKAPPPHVVIPTPPDHYVFYVESYYSFFIPQMVESAVSLVIGLTLMFYSIQKSPKIVALTIIVAVLLVASFYSFYTAYQILNRYEKATQNYFTRISIPNAFYIKDYEKFFIPYTMVGVLSLAIAVILPHISFVRRTVT